MRGGGGLRNEGGGFEKGTEKAKPRKCEKGATMPVPSGADRQTSERDESDLCPESSDSIPRYLYRLVSHARHPRRQ